MDYSLLGSSVHGILQARILEWITIPFSKESSQTRDQTKISCIAGEFFTIWATREAQFFNICKLISVTDNSNKVKNKNQDPLNRCRKCFWQSSPYIHDSTSPETEDIIKIIYETYREYPSQRWKAENIPSKFRNKGNIFSLLFNIVWKSYLYKSEQKK